LQAVLAAREACRGGEVVLVSHAFAILFALRGLQLITPGRRLLGDKVRCETGSVNAVGFDNRGPVSVRYFRPSAAESPK
jgi:broad specificity phosphatase PhoE